MKLLWLSVSLVKDEGFENCIGEGISREVGRSLLENALSQHILTVSPHDGSPGLPSSSTVGRGSHPICVFSDPLFVALCLPLIWTLNLFAQSFKAH